MTASYRFPEMKTLIEVDHQIHSIADCIFDGRDRLEVVLGPVATQPQLKCAEAPFVAQFDRFGCNFRRLVQPKAIAIVGIDVPPKKTQSGKLAAFASASQAAMSSPATAIIDKP